MGASNASLAGSFFGSPSGGFKTEKSNKNHGGSSSVGGSTFSFGGSSKGGSAGPWIMKKRSPENKIVAHCGDDRCRACVLTFKQYACFVAVRGGGFSANSGSGQRKSGRRSDGSSCTYKDTPDSKNTSYSKAALPEGFRARALHTYRSPKYNRGKLGPYPPLNIGSRDLMLHSRRGFSGNEANQIPRYGVPPNATLGDIEATSNSFGCPIVSHECMQMLNSQANGLSFEVREEAGGLNYNDYK